MSGAAEGSDDDEGGVEFEEADIDEICECAIGGWGALTWEGRVEIVSSCRRRVWSRWVGGVVRCSVYRLMHL